VFERIRIPGMKLPPPYKGAKGETSLDGYDMCVEGKVIA
jgi:hypothetical protein